MKILIFSDLQWHIFGIKKGSYPDDWNASPMRSDLSDFFNVSPEWFTDKFNQEDFNLSVRKKRELKRSGKEIPDERSAPVLFNCKGVTNTGSIGYLKKDICKELILKNLVSPLELFIKLIDIESPDLVVFSGDVIADGLVHYNISQMPIKASKLMSNKNALDSGDKSNFSYEFRSLLRYLEDKRITSVTIKGNHDTRYIDDYNQIFNGELNYAHEISNKYKEILGIRFLGIPFESTEKISNCRRLISDYKNKQIDILVAHPSTRRLIFLLSLNPKYLFSGHDQLRICKVRETIMLNTNRCLNWKREFQTFMCQKGERFPFYHPENSQTYGSLDLVNDVITLVDDGKKFIIQNQKGFDKRWMTDIHGHFSFNGFYPKSDENLADLYSEILNIHDQFSNDIHYRDNISKYKKSLQDLMKCSIEEFPHIVINDFFLGIKDYRS